MELQYFGGNCLRISTKKASIVIDDNLADLGLKSITKPTDISLFTTRKHPGHKSVMSIDQPGEYEVSNTSIQGIAARSQMDEEKAHSATIFKLIASDIRVVFLGHVFPKLSNDQLERIGTVDVLVVPVGGSGYTMDAEGALSLIKEIEPKLIVPVHYADKAIKYPVPQLGLEEALKTLSMEPRETTPKLKVKPSEISDTSELIVLERQ